MSKDDGEVGAAVLTIVHNEDELGVGLRLAKEFNDVDIESAIDIAEGWVMLLNSYLNDLRDSQKDLVKNRIH